MHSDDQNESREPNADERAMYAAMERAATRWHDLAPPRWQPPALAAPSASFRAWFPVAASAAALVLVAVSLFLELAEPRFPPLDPALAARLDALEAARTRPARLAAPAGAGSVDEALVVNAVLDSLERERREELATLARLLKAEMDRQALQTEESLRYLVTHQIEDRQQIEALSETVGTLRTRGDADDGDML